MRKSTSTKSTPKACCSLDEQLNFSQENDAIESDEHDHGSSGKWNPYFPSIIAFVLLISGLVLQYVVKADFFTGWIRLGWYLVAYLPVALPVFKDAWYNLKKGDIFNEFFLMSIATIGAFAIGEYPEGVAVMLFYSIGELFQAAAVNKAKNNISALLDVRPKIANVYSNGTFIQVNPETVVIGEKIQVKVGEKVPLDGSLLSDRASLNTAAITGESKPQSVYTGGNVLAGSINLERPIEIKVEKLYDDSSVAKILHLVQNATSKKAETELLIRRLAKIYTPIVVYLALAICFLPYFFVEDYQFSDWLYRALIFLVISCPCALVISIPLGYFGGLGAASKYGILFKGATYMDVLTKVNTLVMDKTGTLTKGSFTIKEIGVEKGMSEDDFMRILLSVEANSTHPIAKAILEYKLSESFVEVTDVMEIAGKGLQGVVNNRNVLVGNKKLMEEYQIAIPDRMESIVESVVLVAVNKKFAGYVVIADEYKEDAKETVLKLKELGLSDIIMLSGDKDSITQKAAKDLGIPLAKGGLLPEEKLKEVESIKRDPDKVVAFIGDGINDAPVLATSDLGIAMGAMGSDVAIETADMIIQDDKPSKIITAYRISKSTQNIIWQNITFALSIKIIVLILGAMGMANMWAAVFADVGVALLAILNAVRLQRMTWD